MSSSWEAFRPLAESWVDCTCRYCGRHFRVPRWKVKSGGGQFHSRACFESYTSEYWRDTEYDRFWVRVDQSGGPDACWPWRASRMGRGKAWGTYGKVGSRGRSARAHRVAWELTHGDIPEGLFVLHRCDVPHCVNPAHLFLGTNDENVRDMLRKGRMARPERKRGVKLNPEQAAEVRRAYAAGAGSYAKVGRLFGVSESTVHRIVSGRSWVATREGADVR